MGGFASYCKMAALILILYAHWSLYLSPLRKNDQWLIGSLGKQEQIDLTSQM